MGRLGRGPHVFIAKRGNFAEKYNILKNKDKINNKVHVIRYLKN